MNGNLNKPRQGEATLNMLADRWDGRCPAKFFELHKVPFYLSLTIELVIVIAPKVAIWFAAQNMVDGNEHRMGNCDQRSLSTSSHRKSVILSAKEAVFLPQACVGALDKCCFQRLVSVVDSPAHAFSRALVVPGA